MTSSLSRGTAPTEDRARDIFRITLVALPFLSPLTGGPFVSAWQTLLTLACICLMAGLGPARWISAATGTWLLAGGLTILLFRGQDFGAWLSALVVVVAIALAAMCASGNKNADASPLGWGLLMAGLLSAVLGLLQYLGLADPLVPLTTVPGLGQAYGNLRQRNQFASLMSMALIAALWLYATRGPRARLPLVLSIVLLVIALSASTSRTGLLELLGVVGAATFMAWRERQSGARYGHALRLPRPTVLAAAIPLYFLFSWLLPKLVGGEVDDMLLRLREGAPDAHSRLLLWHNVLDLIVQRPFSGWGWGELKFAHYSTLFAGPRFVEILDNAHNLPLHLAVELGVPAAAVICGGFCLMVLPARPWRETDPTRLLAWGVLGVIVLHSLLEYPLWYGPFQLVFGLCLGVLWPAQTTSMSCTGTRWLSAPALSRAVAVGLIAIVAYAGWDYARISQIYLAREARLPAYRDDTLAKLRGSWLFAAPVQFAELTLTPVSTANAAEIHALAQRVLHFSPEPRVIVKLIESATLLGKNDEALAQAERFRIAYPHEYARWIEGRPVDDPSE